MLQEVEGFKEKSIANILQSVEKSKETTLARFIFALGIKHIGQIAAEAIADVALDVSVETLLSKDVAAETLFETSSDSSLETSANESIAVKSTFEIK